LTVVVDPYDFNQVMPVGLNYEQGQVNLCNLSYYCQVSSASFDFEVLKLFISTAICELLK